MNDIMEMIDDLRELQQLHALKQISDSDFEQKIEKYENIVHAFELDLEQMHGDLFENVPL